MTNLSKDTSKPSRARLLARAALEVVFRVLCIAAGFLLATHFLGH